MTSVALHATLIDLASEAETFALAHALARLVKAGDLITLSGDIGAGKTTLARALIRDLVGNPDLDVPSPTFTLLQMYDGAAFPIVHADLYRLKSSRELAELGWEEAADGALVLVEWPDRAGDALPEDRLDIALSHTTSGEAGARRALLTGYGAYASRLEQAANIMSFLRASGWGEAKRIFMLGDASTRSYERLTKAEGTAILMNSPARPDGPPVKYGRPYSRIAHLAEDVKPFVALANGLMAAGVSAPAILSADLNAGLLLIEDLGMAGVVDPNGAPIAERYLIAAEVLAKLHQQALPEVLPVEPGVDHRIPPYDLGALEIEIELFLDWYLEYAGAPLLSQRARDAFFAAWRVPLETILNGPKGWVLRDYHSPNLIWLDGREGTKRIGVIDFQDAMIGSPAYDLASLGMDARVTVPEALELQILASYVKARRAADPSFEPAAFVRDYAIMGAQRCTKVLGIFARLNKRDGKPGYLRHIPRVKEYLERALRHSALSPVRAWMEENIR